MEGRRKEVGIQWLLCNRDVGKGEDAVQRILQSENKLISV